MPKRSQHPAAANDPVALQVLDVAARIDFDPAFRRSVLADPADALRAAGLSEPVVREVLDAEVEVEGFSVDPARQLAARAHGWAMARLRDST